METRWTWDGGRAVKVAPGCVLDAPDGDGWYAVTAVYDQSYCHISAMQPDGARYAETEWRRETMREIVRASSARSARQQIALRVRANGDVKRAVSIGAQWIGGV